MTIRASLLLLTYNQAPYVESAARACLAQVCEPIEIVFSDDASTDGTFAILQRVAAEYDGPHTVLARQNPQNQGIAGHYNTLVDMARGQLLITAAGDDISRPERVARLLAAWDSSGEKVDLIASHAVSMGLQGEELGATLKVGDLSRWRSPEDWTRKRPYVIGATHAFTKRLWERFGPIDITVCYEDQVMALRASCLGGGITVPEPLVRYRVGGVSSSSRGTGREDKLQRIEKRYQRQAALYSQIKADLASFGRSDLWRGKVRGYLERSHGALTLLEQRRSGRLDVKPILKIVRKAGVFWTVRQMIYTWTA